MADRVLHECPECFEECACDEYDGYCWHGCRPGSDDEDEEYDDA